jgi:hypothetical protein
MTTHTTSSFAKYQEDICEAPEAPPSRDKICPTCVLDPNYVEPTWWLQTEPFLNKKTCEYSIAISINEQGDYYSPTLFRQRNQTIKQVLRSFVRPAVRKILSFYGKETSDKIVCAIPPSGRSNICRNLSDIGVDEEIISNYTKVTRNYTEDNKLFDTYEFDSLIQRKFPQIKNLDAVELYARAVDYHFGSKKAMPMKVLVTIPAHIVDAIPDAIIDDSGVASFEEVKSVVINGESVREYFKILSVSLGIFGNYQSIFYQEEGGNIFLKIPNSDKKNVFYLSSLQSSVDKTYAKLRSILRNNNFKVGVFNSTKRPEEIKIIFDSENKANPFKIKNIKARYPGCRFRSLKKSDVVSFSNFIEKRSFHRVLMGYIAKINEIHTDLTARETIGWIDFVVKYTYPGVSVDYGKYDPNDQSALSCILPESIGLRKTVDYFLGKKFSLVDAIAYKFNKQNCQSIKDKEEFKPLNVLDKDRAQQRAERQAARDSRDQIKDDYREWKQENAFGQAGGTVSSRVEGWQENVRYPRQIKREFLKANKYHPYYDHAKDAALKEFDYENSLLRAFREMDVSIANLRDNASNFNIAEFLNPCNFTEVSKKAIRCLFAGLSLEEAMKAIAKSALENMPPDYLGQLFVGLPMETQLEIQQAIEREFKNMPAPWDTGWKPGNVNEVGSPIPGKIERTLEGREEQQNEIDDMNRELLRLTSRAEDLEGYPPEGGAIAQLQADLEEAREELQYDPNLSLDRPSQYDSWHVSMLREIEALRGLIEANQADSSFDPTSALEMIDEIHERIDQKFASIENIQQEILDMISELGSIPDQITELLELIEHMEEELENELRTIEGVEIERVKEEEVTSLTLSIEGQKWSELTEQEKEDMVEEERAKANFYSINPGDKYQVGTIGKAAGNIQKLVFAKYVELILDKVGAEELLGYIDRFPGSKLLTFAITSFDCPHPSKTGQIDNFLETLTLDPCAGSFGLGIPKMLRMPKLSKSWLGVLGDVFMDVIEGVITQIFFSIVIKVLETLENALCKAIGTAGRGATALITGDDSSGGLLAVIQQELCSDAVDDKKAADVGGQLLSDMGIMPDDLSDIKVSQGTYKEIAKALGVLATANEVKAAMVSSKSEQDQSFLEGVSSALSTMFPDFSIAFGSPERVGQIFAEAGNYLTPEQREGIRDSIRDESGDFPINPSVCLTDDEKALWDEERLVFWDEAGLPPEDAQDWVDKQNEQAASDFVDIADAMTTDQIKDKLDEILDISRDPDCATNAIKTETAEISVAKDNIAAEIFKNLSVDFAKDIMAKGTSIGRKSFGTPGAFQFILKSKKGKNFSKIKDFEQEAAETVAIQMWKNIIETKYNQEIIYDGERATLEYYDSSHDDVVSLYMKFYYKNTIYEGAHENKKPIKTLDYRIKINAAPVIGGKTPLEAAGEGLTAGLGIATFLGTSTAAAVAAFASTVGTVSGGAAIAALAGPAAPIILAAAAAVILTPAAIGAISAAIKKAKIDYGAFETYEFYFKKNYKKGVQQIIDKNDITESDLRSSDVLYQSRLFTNYINSSLEKIGEQLDPSTVDTKIYPHLNNLIFNDFFKKLFLNRKDKRSRGFSYGYTQGSKITYKDLLYVNSTADPNDESTWEYTYPEELAQLGKSATENPRVIFLDPAFHGGSYKSPKVYIERAKYSGWLAFAEVLMPEINTCRDQGTDFLDFNNLKDRVREIEKSTPFMKELSYDPECVVELPFNKIAAPSTLAYLEGIVLATIRIFISEFLIKGYPIFSNVRMSEENFDELPQFIIQRMEEEMSDMAPFIPSVKVQKEAYWLLFLEQAVQAIQRRLDDEKIQYNDEIEVATKAIRNLQKSYEQPSYNPDVVGLAKFNVDQNSISPIQKRIINGAMVCGFGKKREILFGGGLEKIKLKTKLFTLENSKFACKIGAIDEVSDHCKVLLKYLVSEQLAFYQEKLNKRMTVQPRIYDTKKYFIGGSDIFFGPELNAGLSSVEAPYTEAQSNINYGNVFNVSRDISSDNPLSGHTHEIGKFEDYKSPHILQGGLIIEKYLRIVDKKPNLLASDRVAPPPRYMSERPSNLKGITNIKEFQKFLKNNSDQFDSDHYISNVLGDARITYNDRGKPSGYRGSVGIKYGVRISYVSPSDSSISPLNSGISNNQEKIAQEEKAFKLPPASVTIKDGDRKKQITLNGSSFIIPLCSYEKDIIDRPLSELDLEDGDFGEDLKCYIDKLVNTDEFKFLFDVCLPINRASFFASFYSHNTLIPSIFKDPDEIDLRLGQTDEESEEMTEDDPDMPIGDNMMDRSKEEARKVFRSFYQKEDGESSDDIQSTEDSNYNVMIRNLMPRAFLNLDTKFATRPKFWQLRRIRERPTDGDGNLCKSVFQKVFEQE